MRVVPATKLSQFGDLIPHQALLTDDGTDGGSNTLDANGSSTPVVLYRGPADGKVWYPTAISICIIGTSSTAFDPTSIGPVLSASVGSGIAIDLADDEDEVNILDFQNMLAIIDQATDYQEVTSLTTNDYCIATVDLRKLFGDHLPKLVGSRSEVFRLTSHANLTAIIAGYARLFYLETDERT